MAGFSYESREKLTKTIRAALVKKAAKLSESEQKMLPDAFYNDLPQEVCEDMRQLLRQSKSGKLSGLYRSVYFIGNCDIQRYKRNKSLPNRCLINSCRSMTIRRHALEDIKTFHASLVIK